MLENDKNLEINQTAASYLSDTRKWANFVAIIGFVMTGLLVLVGFAFGSLMSDIPNSEALPVNFSGAFGLIYVVMGLLYFVPTFYLYRFASNTRAALLNKDDISLEEALKYLMRFFKFIGILLIIVMSIYALMIFGMLMGGIFSMAA